MDPISISEPTEPTEEGDSVLDAMPVLSDSVRGSLVGIAVGLLGVFTLAAIINPYEPDGSARSMGTHTQIGLADCGFLRVTGVPCPSCGMTTSFALLMRGDVVNSVRANLAGTGLAVIGLVSIPWCLLSAWRGQKLFVRSAEWAVSIIVLGVAGLALVRWMIVVAWNLSAGGGAGP